MTRYFNTAGPCQPDVHYMLPPTRRLGDLLPFIERRNYYVIHAPRQSGKTTALRALAQELRDGGRHAALHVSCESAARARRDPVQAGATLVQAIREAAADLPPPQRPQEETDNPQAGLLRVQVFLSRWARSCPRPIVLFLDEIDTLVDDALVSVLSQLRAGYPGRPERFPLSIALVGLRDIQDYKIAEPGDEEQISPSTPFIPRELAAATEEAIRLQPRSWQGADGRLDMDRLMEEFVDFWRLNAEPLMQQQNYPELAPQLILMAFLQKVVNGGARVDREYASGARRVDLSIRAPTGSGQPEQREVIEITIWRERRKDPLTDGLAQLDGYLGRIHAERGYLMIFDLRRSAQGVPWEERPRWEQAQTTSGRVVRVLRL